MAQFPNLDGRLLVIYDGCCGFCNRSIRWFAKRDLRDRLRFTSSDSSTVADLLARNDIAALDPSSMVVVRNAGEPNQQVLTRSSGVIAILRELPGPWPRVAAILSIFPRPIRDLGYRAIARLRYHFAGRYASCPVPTLEERRHFL
jgi:predicted DCC family thiol-disulfide oxidoreductase YuxK